MTAGEGESPGNDRNDDPANNADGYENIREISEIQIRYILEQHADAAIYPPRRDGDERPDPVEFVYRRLHLLVRVQDLTNVLSILNPQQHPVPEREATAPRAEEGVRYPIPGLALVPLRYDGEDDPVAEARFLFSALEEIEQQLGPGKAAPDHMMSITPATGCPATEPDWVPGHAVPRPGISRSCCDGRGTLVAVVDTGLVQDAPAEHSWLNGVTGLADRQVDEGVSIARYGGHGTFIASIVRAMAPRAEVRIARDFDKAGALYESGIVRALLKVLDWAPDVISLSAGTHTWKHRGLLSFHVFVNGPLRECQGTVLVAAAGNDGADWRFSPAEMDSVVGVGALGPPGDARAWFSDYGDWVKVFAPGVDLVHAFARGTYEYQELRAGQSAEFSGMARWSGTSFSTPVVSGLVAARMSGTGESAHEASESLLRLARAQALPGVGPVLRPGQACLCACGQPGRDRPSDRRCGCRAGGGIHS
jgi:subtilisin family serine protease